MLTAPELATRLGLKRSGREWRGACPCCEYPDTFSVTVRAGRALAWCASCQDRQAIARVIATGGRFSGPLTPSEQHGGGNAAERRRASQERALNLWGGSVTVPDTPAERYLTRRGLPHLAASLALRFRDDCPHPGGARLPAMVALISAPNGGPVAIHRTFLRRDGSGKADIEPAKASVGPIMGGAIRLDPVAEELAIGEGIETSASAGLLLGLPAWAAISAGNLERDLVLPPDVRAVVIAADHDKRGQGQRAAAAAAARWQAEGRRVRIATPDVPGSDFNDLLRSRMEAGHAE